MASLKDIKIEIKNKMIDKNLVSATAIEKLMFHRYPDLIKTYGYDISELYNYSDSVSNGHYMSDFNGYINRIIYTNTPSQAVLGTNMHNYLVVLQRSANAITILQHNEGFDDNVDWELDKNIRVNDFTKIGSFEYISSGYKYSGGNFYDSDDEIDTDGDKYVYCFRLDIYHVTNNELCSLEIETTNTEHFLSVSLFQTTEEYSIDTIEGFDFKLQSTNDNTTPTSLETYKGKPNRTQMIISYGTYFRTDISIRPKNNKEDVNDYFLKSDTKYNGILITNKTTSHDYEVKAPNNYTLPDPVKLRYPVFIITFRN